jgi:hypothetical protein
MLVVVGGHSRNIGKTSVMAGLIDALPEFHWTAVKITQYGSNVCSSEGEPCGCAGDDPNHPYALSEERDPASGTDSSRYLAAGARRSYWLRTAVDHLGDALPVLRCIMASSEHIIVESNSILQFFRPDLYLVVADFSVGDFKASGLKHLDRADALVVIERELEQPQWSGVSRQLWESKKRFPVQPPQYVTEAMAAFVRGRLISSTTPSGGAPGAGSTRSERTGTGR